MEYITVRETAKKWNISERLVQKYCAQGRIDSVRKFGVSWKIPSDAIKPKDPRKTVEQRTISLPHATMNSYSGLMPLMNTTFTLGHCQEYINEMPELPKKQIALAEYLYFSGHPKEATQKVELYLTSPEMEIRLSACLIYAYASLSIGQIKKAKYTLWEVEKAMDNENKDTTLELHAAKAFVAGTAAVLLHLPLPEGLPPMTDYLPLLPPGLRIFALYVQAHYLYLQKKYGESLGIVEATLIMQEEVYPIPLIYLHLAAVMDYMSLRQPLRAKEHLLIAWEYARPDKLIEGFGEHHGLLGGMLEANMKKEWPEDFKHIIAITHHFSEGWRKIHNQGTGQDVADNLTTTEFAVAMLAARGWTNQEIAQQMNISLNTAKRHISTVLQKLGINHRKELNKHMLQ